MVKLFDYEHPRHGWVEFSTYEAAKSYVEKTFHTYWLHDRDDYCTCYMEIYNNGEYEVWCGEFGSWLYSEEDETPENNVYHGSRKDFEGSMKFTTLHPRKDYILI